jgi:hypothetical protein
LGRKRRKIIARARTTAKTKAILVGSPFWLAPAFGRAVAPFRRGLYGTREAYSFEEEELVAGLRRERLNLYVPPFAKDAKDGAPEQ